MPELPEVETIVRKLRTRVIGERFVKVTVNWARSIAAPSPERFAAELIGREVRGVERRGKYITLILAPQKYVMVHLRMTGRLIFSAKAYEPHELATDPHTHVIFEFASHDKLYFRDTRKFGRLWLVDDPAEVTAGLGFEPLGVDFSPAVLAEGLRRHHRSLKASLLDQSLLAGLGNIYADESLWLSQLHPQRSSDALTSQEIDRLFDSIGQVLACALENRGTTLRDYRDPDDLAGANEACLQAYGRTGEPCPRCGTPIERIIVAQRSTHFCPHCQVIQGA